MEKTARPADGAAREMLSLLFLLFGQNSRELGLNGRSGRVGGFRTGTAGTSRFLSYCAMGVCCCTPVLFRAGFLFE